MRKLRTELASYSVFQGTDDITARTELEQAKTALEMWNSFASFAVKLKE